MPELAAVAAAVRPDDWNLPLFVHVLGAMVLVGGLLTCVVALPLARGDARLQRLGWGALLLLGVPGWIAMRAAAEWVYDKEGWTGDDDPAWLGIGSVIADLGGVLLLAALITGGIGVRRARDGGGARLLTATTLLAGFALAGYLIAVWAMGGKPT